MSPPSGAVAEPTSRSAPPISAGDYVAIELVLAIDVSASVDAREYHLQMKGVADAFRDADVQAAILANGVAGVAATLVHWSAGPDQTHAVDWARLNDEASILAFAAAVEAAPRRIKGRTTAIGSAIAFSRQLLRRNNFAGEAQIIDVSGDGRSNDGVPLFAERERAEAAGVRVNGLAIADGDDRLTDYFKEHVVVGPGAFVVTARDFDDFARAMRKKLLRELEPLVAQRRTEERLAWLDPSF